jgi:hypothetical protein
MNIGIQGQGTEVYAYNSKRTVRFEKYSFRSWRANNQNTILEQLNYSDYSQTRPTFYVTEA